MQLHRDLKGFRVKNAISRLAERDALQTPKANPRDCLKPEAK
jgi:hypothetical protein